MKTILHIQNAAEAYALIEQYNVGAFICNVNGAITYEQLPFLLQYNKSGDEVKLFVAIKKNTDNAEAFEQASQVLCVFQGPQCYVSPTWLNDANVMDWSFKNVQIEGFLKTIDNNLQKEVANNLLLNMEQKVERKFSDKYDANLIVDKSLMHFNVYEVSVEKIQTNFALQQNLTESQQLAIIRELKKQNDFNALLVAFEIEEALKKSRRILKAVKF